VFLFRARCLPAEDFPRTIHQSQREPAINHFADRSDRKRAQALLAHIAEIGAQAHASEGKQKRPPRKIGERSHLILVKKVIGRKHRDQQEAENELRKLLPQEGRLVPHRPWPAPGLAQ